MAGVVSFLATGQADWELNERGSPLLQLTGAFAVLVRVYTVGLATLISEFANGIHFGEITSSAK